MCLTLDALIVFLNLIGPEHVTAEPGRFIVHAEQGDAHWVEVSEHYCTVSPQLDRMAKGDD